MLFYHTFFLELKVIKSILFVRVENAGRSQMAEGFFNKYAPKGYEARNKKDIILKYC